MVITAKSNSLAIILPLSWFRLFKTPLLTKNSPSLYLILAFVLHTVNVVLIKLIIMLILHLSGLDARKEERAVLSLDNIYNSLFIVYCIIAPMRFS
ncbi:hypothetical protein P9112_010118 [Eukaryota sp. TZLM1-RC]